MQGEEGVKLAIAACLGANILGALEALQTELGPLTDGTDDAVTSCFPTAIMLAPPPLDSIGIDTWPFLALFARPAGQLKLRDWDPAGGAGGLYVMTYAVQVNVWVRGSDWQNVDSVRGRLQLAVRTVLLTEQLPAPWLQLDPSKWSESYAPPGVDATIGATVGGGVCASQWTASETLVRPGAPRSGPVTVTVGRAGADTALASATLAPGATGG